MNEHQGPKRQMSTARAGLLAGGSRAVLQMEDRTLSLLKKAYVHLSGQDRCTWREASCNGP